MVDGDAFPNIKVIYLMRAPDKVINSMLNRKWGYSVNKELKFTLRSYSLDECIKIWNASALAGKIIIQKNEFKNRVMLLKFEDLIQYPERCSKMIQEFAEIKSDLCFTPMPTSKVNLDAKTLDEIHKKTQQYRAHYGY